MLPLETPKSSKEIVKEIIEREDITNAQKVEQIESEFIRVRKRIEAAYEMGFARGAKKWN